MFLIEGTSHFTVTNFTTANLFVIRLKLNDLDANLAPGEYDDGRPSGIMDLTQDFSKACPNYANFVEMNKTSLPTRSKTLANVYPFNQALDVLRIVGRQEDGGAIYLGKTYLQDYFRADKQAATIAFWVKFLFISLTPI